MIGDLTVALCTHRLAGRVYRGSPAPTNVPIPPHRYLSASTIRVGDDGKA